MEKQVVKKAARKQASPTARNACINHGKTTLSAAIMRVLSQHGEVLTKEYDEIEAAPEAGEPHITMSIALEGSDADAHCVIYVVNGVRGAYETRRGYVVEVDRPGHADYVENMVPGITRWDDAEFLDLVEMEVCALLGHDHLLGDVILVVQDHAPRALPSVAEPNAEDLEVMDAVDCIIALSECLIDPDFLMPAEDVFAIADRGAVGHGGVRREIFKKRPAVPIVSPRPAVNTTVTDIEMFRKLLDEGRVGDNVGLLLRGVKKIDVGRGQTVIKTGSGRPRGKVKGGGGRRARSKRQQEQAELSILELAAQNGCGMVRVVNSPTELQTERQKPPFLASAARTGSLAPSLKVPAIDLVC